MHNDHAHPYGIGPRQLASQSLLLPNATNLAPRLPKNMIESIEAHIETISDIILLPGQH